MAYLKFIIPSIVRKLLAVSLLSLIYLFYFGGEVSAQTATPTPTPQATVAPGVCVSVYGGGVVCGAQAPEHKPVPAALGDNLALLGGTLIILSAGLFYISKRKLTKSIQVSDFKGGEQ